MNIFELSASLTLDKKNYEDGLNQAENQANKAGSKITGVFNELGNSADDTGKKVKDLSNGFTVMKGAIANLAGNYLSSAIDGIKNLAGEAISSSDSLKKFESTMQFAGYDGTQINKARDDMKEYADKTVYDLQTISNTTAQLAANGVQDYEKLTEAAGNLNAVAGGNSDTFRSVAMVLTQTAGAGKLTTENWNQLANAIPGASGKIQEALQANGAYTGEFRDAMAKGQITAEEFNQTIMSLGFTDAAQQAATSTDTFEGAVGNLQAAVTDGLMKIYDAIGSENITGFINNISDFVANVIPPIETAVSWFVDNLPQIAPLLTGIGTGLGVILVAQKVEAMVTAFQAWKAATEGMTIAQAALNAVQLANPIGLIIAAIAALVAGFITLWNTSDSFRNFWIGLWDGIKTVVGTVVDAIVGFFTETLPNGIKAVIDWFANLPANIANLLGQLIQKVNSAARNIIESIPQFILQMLNGFGLAIKQLLEMGKKWVNALKDGIKSLDPVAWGRDLIEGFISGLREKWEKLKSTVSNIAGSIKELLGFSEPEKGPLSNFHTYAPDMMELFMQGIKDNKKALQNTVMDDFDFQNLITTPEMKSGDEISGRGGQMSGLATNVWNVTFNQPVNDAIDFAKKMREEEQYGLIGGGNLAY